MRNKNENENGFFYLLLSLILAVAVGLFIIRSSHVFEKYSSIDYFGNMEKLTSISSEKYKEIKDKQEERYAIIYDKADDVSVSTKENTEILLQYLKKEYESTERKTYTNFNDYSTVIVTFESIADYSQIRDLYYYVNNGGSVIIAQRPYITEKLHEYLELFGIKSYTGFEKTIGMNLLSNILITGEGLEIGEEISNHSIKVELFDDVEVHATDSLGIPLVWENNFGQGKVIFSNGQMLREKSSRGIYTGILSLGNESFIYPIINSKVLFIDDFPSPIPTATEKIIYDEYEKETPEFFRDIWWPDMVSISKKYDVTYTGYYIETYKNSTTSLHNNRGNDIDKKNIITYGRELLKLGGEIGLHGFNHQPLAVGKNKMSDRNGYNTWNNIKDMVYGINLAKTTLESVFPNNKIVSYVPPSNIITEEGIEALKEALPDLKIIASVYVGDEEDAYIQEIEIRDDGILNFPRMSYGYIDTNEVEYDLLSSITTFGLISHFLHGDDVLDDERSFGLKWSELAENFEKMMKRIYETLPWIKSETVSEAGADIINYLNQEVVFTYEEDRIIGALNNYKCQGSYILRTHRKVIGSVNCSYELIDDNTYLITNEDAEFIIELGE